MTVNNITKDMELKQKAFGFMEEVTKLGYWCTHSILIADGKNKKMLTIEVHEVEELDSLLAQPSMRERRVKKESRVLELIAKNPGIQPKMMEDRLAGSMGRRNISYILKSLLDRKLIKVKSSTDSKSDPTRQYYLAAFKEK